jgi:hypothetical protein
MKFVEFVTINPENGKRVTAFINPEQVCFVAPAVIPGDIAGPNGEKIGKTVAVVGFGVQNVIVDCTREEAIKRLEGVRLVDKNSFQGILRKLCKETPPQQIVKFPQDKGGTIEGPVRKGGVKSIPISPKPDVEPAGQNPQRSGKAE